MVQEPATVTVQEVSEQLARLLKRCKTQGGRDRGERLCKLFFLVQGNLLNTHSAVGGEIGQPTGDFDGVLKVAQFIDEAVGQRLAASPDPAIGNFI